MSKYRITLNGQVYEMEIEALDDSAAVERNKPQTETAPMAQGATAVQTAPATGAETGDGAVVSPMPGTVVKVTAAQGDKVEAGQPVLVLEAMKMENEITAPKSGVISAMYVGEGQTVAGGEALFEIGE